MLLSCFRTKMSDKVATLPPEVDEDEDCVEPDGEGAADTADEYSDSPSEEAVTVVETEEYKAGSRYSSHRITIRLKLATQVRSGFGPSGKLNATALKCTERGILSVARF